MKGDLFHVFNRGVEKRKIFFDVQDYTRFVDNLFLLNNKSGKIRTERRNIFHIPGLEQKKLVEVLKWSLLPNHYHLLLYEIEDGGALEFVKRLGNAYTKYFNIKNKGRSGYLFQNSAKIVPIENNPQFLYIPFYIDLNPLDIKFPNWEDKKVDSNAALSFLTNYKWSSLGGSRGYGMGSIDNTELFCDLFDTDERTYQQELLDYLKSSEVVPPVNLAG